MPRLASRTEKGRNLQLGKLVGLVNVLLEGGVLNVKAIEQTVGVKPGQARRYHAVLRDLQGVRETASGLQFSKTFLFTPASQAAVVASALTSGLAELFRGTRYEYGMREALAYIAVRTQQPIDPDGLRRRFQFAIRGGDPLIAQKAGMLEDVVQSVLQNRRMHIRYVTFEGTRRTAVVEPLTLLVYDHQLYLVTREKDQTFHALRFSRITSALPMKQLFEYPPPNVYNLDELLKQVWGVFVGYLRHELTTVLVRFAPGWRAFTEGHRWHETQQNLGEGRVQFHLRPCPEFEQWVLGLGGDVEVLEPQWLRDRIAERALAGAQIYESRVRHRSSSPLRRAPRAKSRQRSRTKRGRGRSNS